VISKYKQAVLVGGDRKRGPGLGASGSTEMKVARYEVPVTSHWMSPTDVSIVPSGTKLLSLDYPALRTELLSFYRRIRSAIWKDLFPERYSCRVRSQTGRSGYSASRSGYGSQSVRIIRRQAKPPTAERRTASAFPAPCAPRIL